MKLFFITILFTSTSSFAADVTNLMTMNPWAILSWGVTVITVIGTLGTLFKKSRDKKTTIIPPLPAAYMDIDAKFTLRLDKIDDKIERKSNELHERIDSKEVDIQVNSTEIARVKVMLDELKSHTAIYAEEHRKDVKGIYRAFGSWREETKEETQEIKQLIIRTLLDPK